MVLNMTSILVYQVFSKCFLFNYFTKLQFLFLFLPLNNKRKHKMEKKDLFQYTIDEFYDCKVMKYQVPMWEKLTLNQKQYLYYLSQAALWGRDIYFDQNYKNNIMIRKVLEIVLETYDGDKYCNDWYLFENYCKRFFFSNGIHHHYGEKKFLPECSKEYFLSILKRSNFSIKRSDFLLKRRKKEISLDDFFAFIINEVFNPNIAPIRRSNDAKNDIVKSSSVNFYENISRQEAQEFYSKQSIPNEQEPISLGLNSKLVKEGSEIKEEVYKIGGKYGREIEKIVYYLNKAQEFAENDKQKAYTKELIEFYKTGDLTTWDKYNILWCQDDESVCDYVNGFVETYNDPLGMKATWESVVDFKDIEQTKRTKTLCVNAQWFEDNSPINPNYRKKQVKGVSAKVINAVILAGDCYPTPPIGINLPNADWIRKEYGSKSVTISNLTDAYFFASMEKKNSALNEFAYSEKEKERAKTYGRLADNLHTDMHECLGHGSGQLLPNTSSNALKEYSSTLEEARADLFALYYLMDKKLLELNLMPSMETGKAQYDSYIRNGLMVQLARIPLNEKLTEAHMQDRALIANYALLNGNCIKKEIKDKKIYFIITDYEKLRECFGHLLFIIQDIKSRGDYEKGKELVEKYGVNIDKDLHKEIIERYNKLSLKPYGGFVNPDYSLVKDEKGNVVDVKISYTSSFLEQEIKYGKEYSIDE